MTVIAPKANTAIRAVATAAGAMNFTVNDRLESLKPPVELAVVSFVILRPLTNLLRIKALNFFQTSLDIGRIEARKRLLRLMVKMSLCANLSD